MRIPINALNSSEYYRDKGFTDYVENLDSGEDESFEEFQMREIKDKQWAGELAKSNPNLLQNQTYIAFVNQSRKPIEKGSEAFYTYGNRSNYDLLMYYGFAL